MLRTVNLFNLLQVVFNAGIVNALDEGRFLWAQKTVENFTDNQKSIITPGRWTRSIFNWLHSPLINSIQEAFVIDSVYENLEPVTKCLKRCVSKKVGDLNVEERFENEFFLWEDNEGSPLEFGLKQIQELKPYYGLSHENVFRRSSEDRSSSLWEEPLFYEDNHDAKDIDVNNLSYHEQLKLNDILKNKMHSVMTHIFPHRSTTKNHSLYYTLPPDSTKLTTTTVWPKFGKEYFLKKLKTGYLTHINKDDRNPEANRNREIGTIKDIDTFSAFNSINIANISKHKLKNRSFYNYNAYMEDITTKSKIINSTPMFQCYLKTIISKSKDPAIAKGLLSPLDKANHDSDSFASFWNKEIRYNENTKTLKPANIEKSCFKEGTNHRDLRTVHHRRFLKHRRKGKWKNKSKNPEGRSYQYELFSGNIKTSP